MSCHRRAGLTDQAALYEIEVSKGSSPPWVWWWFTSWTLWHCLCFGYVPLPFHWLDNSAIRHCHKFASSKVPLSNIWMVPNTVDLRTIHGDSTNSKSEAPLLTYQSNVLEGLSGRGVLTLMISSIVRIHYQWQTLCVLVFDYTISLILVKQCHCLRFYFLLKP